MHFTWIWMLPDLRTQFYILKTREIGLTNAMLVWWLSAPDFCLLLFHFCSIVYRWMNSTLPSPSLIQISPHFINTLFTLSGHFGNELIKTVMRRHIFCLPLPVLVYPQLKGLHIKLRFVCLFWTPSEKEQVCEQKHSWSWGNNRVIIRCFPH